MKLFVDCLIQPGSGEVIGFVAKKESCPTVDEFIEGIKNEYGEEYKPENITSGYAVKSINDGYRTVKNKTPKSFEIWIAEDW